MVKPDVARSERRTVRSPKSSPQPLAEASEGRALTSDLSASIGDATAFGVMVGIGETYIPAFTLAVGLGDVFAGLIATIPLLVGSVLQLISPWAVARLESHRRWVVLCAAAQGVCFVPLVIAAVAGHISPWVAMAVSSLYWGMGLATGPAWNTWQGTIIPRSIRANFFARRSKLQQIATLTGFLLAGFSLQYVRQTGGDVILMFAGLFLVACVCRLLSTACLWWQSEPCPMPPGLSPFSMTSAWRQFTGPSTRSLMLMAVFMQAGVYVSGPYFNPYMLKVLHFSYAGYAVLLGTSFVAKFLCLPLWGRYAHRHGAKRLMWVGALSIIPLASGWVLSDDYWWLLVLQVFSGVAWGAYELALMLLFFETIPERERTNVLTVYNVVNSLALVLGSAFGALILMLGEVSQPAYLCVFGLSTVVRLSSLYWMARLPDVNVPAGGAMIRPLAMRPSSGSIDDPVLTTMPDQVIPPPHVNSAPPSEALQSCPASDEATSSVRDPRTAKPRSKVLERTA